MEDKTVVLSGSLSPGGAQVVELVAMINAIKWGLVQAGPAIIFTGFRK